MALICFRCGRPTAACECFSANESALGWLEPRALDDRHPFTERPVVGTLHRIPVNPPHPVPGWPEVQAAIETARIFRSSGEQALRDGQVLTAADLDALWERAATGGFAAPLDSDLSRAMGVLLDAVAPVLKGASA